MIIEQTLQPLSQKLAMDHVEQLGERALVSRIRRLAERMHNDNALIFKERSLPFEPRWFLILSLLDKQAPLSIMEIARELGIKHPTVNQMVNEIIRKGFIIEIEDARDKRKRLLALNEDGKTLIQSLYPLWEDMSEAAHEVTRDCGYDIIAVLSSIERILDQRSYYDRIRHYVQQREWNSITVRPFKVSDAARFKSLHEAWMETPYAPEDVEAACLKQPRQKIIDAGGQIWMAERDAEIVGTCALINVSAENRYEVAFLSVDPAHRNRQVGKKLLQTVTGYARDTLELSALWAEMNHQQTQAIHLLRQIGFVTVSQKGALRLKRNNVLLKADLRKE